MNLYEVHGVDDGGELFSFLKVARSEQHAIDTSPIGLGEMEVLMCNAQRITEIDGYKIELSEVKRK